MGRELHYVPGSFYRTDDRSGFPVRAGRTKKQWDNLIVDRRFFEPRQPQDLVKGRPDIQTVPEPRPLAPNVFVGSLYTSLTEAALAQAQEIQIEMAAIALLVPGSDIGIMMDNGEVFRTTVTRSGQATLGDFVLGQDVLGDGANSVGLAAPLPYPAASNNDVVIYEPTPALPA